MKDKYGNELNVGDEDGNPIYLEEWYDFKDEVILIKRKEGKENEETTKKEI